MSARGGAVASPAKKAKAFSFDGGAKPVAAAALKAAAHDTTRVRPQPAAGTDAALGAAFNGAHTRLGSAAAAVPAIAVTNYTPQGRAAATATPAGI